MPRKLHNALTAVKVKTAKPGRHADGGGLQLLVKQSGARSWVYRYMIAGKSRDLGLGPAAGVGAISLSEARDLADALRVKVKSGIDPLSERRQEASEVLAAAQSAKVAGMTFKASAEAHVATNKPSWRNAKHRQQWENTLATYAYPIIGDLPVAEIDTPHVLKILEPIWREKTETASRLRGRIETVLDSAKARGFRHGENPARWRGHLEQILPARKKLSRGHHKAMPYDSIPAFVAQLRQREAVASLALEFTILTAARTGEVIGATWSEVDLDKAIWTVPAERMKAGKEHRVPLSPRAVEILASRQGLEGEHCFASLHGKKLSGMAMAMLLRRMKQDVTVHGFRSAFRDWSAECTEYPYEVAEMALAHTIGSKTVRAYLRADLKEKRRELMLDWAVFCENPIGNFANVHSIRAKN
ncbi:MAG: integrase arm-type DNA-binding domain-containing protein [Azonexus sp.]|nr:integrase arm-type DNA-binding domain-containing protein [Azonexus sp.]